MKKKNISTRIGHIRQLRQFIKYFYKDNITESTQAQEGMDSTYPQNDTEKVEGKSKNQQSGSVYTDKDSENNNSLEQQKTECLNGATLNKIQELEDCGVNPNFLSKGVDEDRHSLRTKKGKNLILKSGGRPFMIPMGYHRMYDIIVPNDEKAPLIKKALELFSQGLLPTKEDVFMFLSGEGLKNSGGGPIKYNTVEHIFKDTTLRFYCGRIFHPQHGIIIPIKAEHEAIIDGETLKKIMEKEDICLQLPLKKSQKNEIYSISIPISESSQQIAHIPISDILDRLGIKYKTSGDCLYLFESGEITSGCKASINRNMVSDFSEKGRARGGPRGFVKHHLGMNSQETFDWFVKNFNIKHREGEGAKKYY